MIINPLSTVIGLGAPPLSDSAPPFDETEHPLQPTELWGDWPEGAPRPTNQWWGNLVLENGDQPVGVLPFEVKAMEDGLHVCMPEKTTDTTFILVSTFPGEK